MDDISSHLLSVFLGFFAIMNPLANTTVFVGLTSNMSAAERVRTATKALLITFAIILLFSVLGKTLFHFFGITLPALRITGGILVFLIGYHMLQGASSSMHSTEASADNLAISPLAVPILAGPGTIATAMNFSASGELLAIGTTVGMFALLCFITWLCFFFSEQIVRHLNSGLLDIITRLMGLILAVIGVQMLIEGAAGALPLLGLK